MDNAAYHKTNQVQRKLEEMTANICFLPAYTPQFQPVEIFFGIVKCKLKELKLSNTINLEWRKGEKLIRSILKTISPSTIIKCFKKAIVSMQEVLK